VTPQWCQSGVKTILMTNWEPLFFRIFRLGKPI
jgi:hypothetical protein